MTFYAMMDAVRKAGCEFVLTGPASIKITGETKNITDDLLKEIKTMKLSIVGHLRNKATEWQPWEVGLIEWLRGAELPVSGFQKSKCHYIGEPEKWKQYMLREVEFGPTSVMARMGLIYLHIAEAKQSLS